MPHLAKALSNKTLQAGIRRVLGERPGFQVEHELPEFLREKLRRLDEVTAEKPQR